MKNIICIDVGGTWTRVARADDRRLVRRLDFPTQQSWAREKTRLAKAISHVSEGRKVQRVVIGLPGVLDHQHRTLLTAPNLRSWIRRPITRDLTFLTRSSVRAENDSALAGVGEAVYGSGRGARIMAYIGIGTGVGGARIVAGRIDERTYGFEPGHFFLDGKHTFEQLVGGKRLQRPSHPSWARVQHSIARGLVTVSVMWSPDLIVLGGGVMEHGHLSLPDIRQALGRLLHVFPTPPRIVHSKLYSDAALYGGLVLLRSKQK